MSVRFDIRDATAQEIRHASQYCTEVGQRDAWFSVLIKGVDRDIPEVEWIRNLETFGRLATFQYLRENDGYPKSTMIARFEDHGSQERCIRARHQRMIGRRMAEVIVADFDPEVTSTFMLGGRRCRQYIWGTEHRPLLDMMRVGWTAYKAIREEVERRNSNDGVRQS